MTEKKIVNHPAFNIEYPTPSQWPNLTKSLNFDKNWETLKSSPISSWVFIADFDETFTRKFVNGNKTLSSFGVIDHSNLLSKSYRDKCEELSKYYKGFEFDLSLDYESRSKLLYTWYETALELMVKEKLSNVIIEKIMAQTLITENCPHFRFGTFHFFELLLKFNIPLLWISAGIGEVIKKELELLLGKEFYEWLSGRGLIHIIANKLIFNDQGDVVDFMKPIIYTMNKKEFVDNELSLLKKKEINILFFGDNVHDIDAIEGLRFNNVVSVAFVNYEDQDIPDEYYKKYDVVVKGDGDFMFINSLVEDIGSNIKP